MATLTISDVRIGTEDGQIPLDNYAVFNKASIGSKLQLVVGYTLSGDLSDGVTAFELAGAGVFFNPAAFLSLGQKWFPNGSYPLSSYFVRIPSNGAATYSMVLQGNNAGFQSNVSGDVELEVLTATTFTITHDFYLTTDIDGYLTGRVVNVIDRLTNVFAFQDNRFDTSIRSVYSENKSLGIITAIIQQDDTVIVEGSQEIRGNFYNTHVDGQFGQPVFDVLDLGDNPLDINLGFSQYVNTQYRCRIPNPNAITPDIVRVVAWEVTDALNGTWENSVKLVDFELLNAPVGAAPYMGFFKQPSRINVGANIDLIVTVDHALVDPSKQYFIAFLVGYTEAGEEAYQSFILPAELATAQPPTPVTVSIIDYISNYNDATGDIPNDISGGSAQNLTVDQRIEMGVLFDRVGYDNDVQAAGYGAGFNNDFLRFDLEIRRDSNNELLYKTFRERLPNGNFPDDGVFSYQNIGDWFVIKHQHRMPGYNENDNLTSWDNGIIDFIYTLRFSYGTFQVRYNYEQKIDFAVYNQSVKPVILRGSDGLPANDICGEEFLVVRTQQIGTGDYKQIAILDREPFGNAFTQDGQIREHESFAGTPAFAGNPPIPQLEMTPIYDVDENFQTIGGTGKFAFFKIDLSQIDTDTRYMVKVIQLNQP